VPQTFAPAVFSEASAGLRRRRLNALHHVRITELDAKNALMSFAPTRRPSANYRMNHPAQPVTSEVKIGDDWTLYLSSQGQGVTILDHDVASSVIYLPLLPLCQLVMDYLCPLYLWGEIYIRLTDKLLRSSRYESCSHSP
jgi:hypothetical protein